MFWPSTVDWYDGNSRRGSSRDRSSSCNLEGTGPGNTLGLGHGNADVHRWGLCNYHAVSPSLVSDLKGSMVGMHQMDLKSITSVPRPFRLGGLNQVVG